MCSLGGEEWCDYVSQWVLSRIIRRGLHEYENSIAEECKRMFMLKGWLMLIYARNTKGENEVQVTLYDIIAYIPL